MTFVDEMRRLLLAQRRHLLAQDARVEAEHRVLDDDVETEVTETGQERALAFVLERLDDHCRDELAAINRALARIARGEYGLCIGCGEAIPPARQRALPTTDRCRPCAEMVR